MSMTRWHENKSAREVMGEPALRVIAHELVSRHQEQCQRSTGYTAIPHAPISAATYTSACCASTVIRLTCRTRPYQNVLQQAEALSSRVDSVEQRRTQRRRC